MDFSTSVVSHVINMKYKSEIDCFYRIRRNYISDIDPGELGSGLLVFYYVFVYIAYSTNSVSPPDMSISHVVLFDQSTLDVIRNYSAVSTQHRPPTSFPRHPFTPDCETKLEKPPAPRDLFVFRSRHPHPSNLTQIKLL